jgi:hypothetical protein
MPKNGLFPSCRRPNGSRLDVNWKPEPAGAPLILTTAFNNPKAVNFGGKRLLEQA